MTEGSKIIKVRTYVGGDENEYEVYYEGGPRQYTDKNLPPQVSRFIEENIETLQVVGDMVTVITKK